MKKLSSISTNTTKLEDNSIIVFHTLNFQPATRTHIFLGSKETESYVRVSHYWGEVVNFSKTPVSLNDLVEHLTKLYPRYFSNKNALFKIKLFIMQLVKHNLVQTIDGMKTSHITKKAFKPYGTDIQHLLKFFFSKPAIYIYSLIGLATCILVGVFPFLRPSYSDFFWSQSNSISLLTFFFFSWTTGLLHELAHFLTALSRGVLGKISLSYRLNFLVIETKYPNILSVSKKWRIRTFAAGIIFDLVSIFGMYIVILISHFGYLAIHPSIIALVKQVILFQWLAIGWQFLFYMRTDMYYILREFLEIENLYTYTRINILSLLKGQKFPIHLTPGEKKIVNGYTCVFVVGVLIAAIRYGFYQIPIAVRLFIEGTSNLTQGFAANNLHQYADGAIVLFIQSATFLTLTYLIYKKRGDLL